MTIVSLTRLFFFAFSFWQWLRYDVPVHVAALIPEDIM